MMVLVLAYVLNHHAQWRGRGELLRKAEGEASPPHPTGILFPPPPLPLQMLQQAASEVWFLTPLPAQFR